jgi:hypothetical protein
VEKVYDEGDFGLLGISIPPPQQGDCSLRTLECKAIQVEKPWVAREHTIVLYINQARAPCKLGAGMTDEQFAAAWLELGGRGRVAPWTPWQQ